MRRLVLGMAAGALLAGCGESEEERVVSAVRSFVEASAAADGRRACELLDPGLHAGYAEESPPGVEPSCAEGFRKLASLRQAGLPSSTGQLLDNSTFNPVITEDSAEVRVVPLGRYWLRKDDGRWRITDWE